MAFVDSPSYCSFSLCSGKIASEDSSVVPAQLEFSFMALTSVLAWDKAYPELPEEFNCGASSKEHNCFFSERLSDVRCSRNTLDFTGSWPCLMHWTLSPYSR